MLAFFLCLTLYVRPVQASEHQRTEIPVSTEISGQIPAQAEIFTVIMEAVNDAPLPEKTEIQTDGTGHASFIMDYGTPGAYCYRIWQQPGSNSRGYYDRTVYYIKITVTNGENNKLESAASVYRDSEMKGKKSEIIFTNTYEKKKSPAIKQQADSVGSQTVQKHTAVQNVQKTVSGQSVKTSTKPETGDNTSVLFWTVLLVATGIILVVLYIKLIRRKNR